MEKLGERTGRPRRDDKWTRVNHNLLPGFVFDSHNPHLQQRLLLSIPQTTTAQADLLTILSPPIDVPELRRTSTCHACTLLHLRSSYQGRLLLRFGILRRPILDRDRTWLHGYRAGGMSVIQREDEKFDDFKTRVRDGVDDSD